jgi:hypothetical protein
MANQNAPPLDKPRMNWKMASLARAVRPWLMKRKIRWSIIPEHIPWENRGVDPEKRNTPIEKA